MSQQGRKASYRAADDAGDGDPIAAAALAAVASVTKVTFSSSTDIKTFPFGISHSQTPRIVDCNRNGGKPYVELARA